jgi:PAS domain S-box-containing protein
VQPESALADLHRVVASRLEAIGELVSALSNTRDRAQVSDVIVERGRRIAGADVATLYVLNDAGTAFELTAARGAAPEILDRVRRLEPAAWTSGPVWAEDESAYRAIFPSLVDTDAEGPRAKAFWSVPLVAEGGRIGLLGMGFYAPRAFPSDERAFVQTFCTQCAQALVRAARVEREDAAGRLLATTLASIGDAVVATDTAGHVTFMNPIAESLTGWREADAKGKALEDVFAIYSDVTKEAVESPVTKVLREGSIVGLANHTVLRARGGREIPIHDSAAPIRDANGRLFGVVLVFRDATEEKRDEARKAFLAHAGATLASSLDYRTTLAHVAQLAVPELADWCSVSVVEAPGGKPQQLAVSHVDPKKVAWARELGEKYPADPDAKTGAPQVIRTGKSELYHEIPAAILEAGARDAEHLRIIRELRLESAIIVPLESHDHVLGAMTFIYADSGRRYDEDDLRFAEDFAHRAAMAIENARALKRLDEARREEQRLRRDAEVANRAKDEFLATVSHELRTPLNAILGWTVTLRERKPPEDIDRALAIVERNARRQARLIEDVLDVSRIITGKLALTLAPTNLADVVQGALEAVAPAAAAKGVSLELEGDPAMTLVADPDRLQQIVWNLVANAIKFTPKGGRVALDVHREGSDVCISVTDTGDGIASDALPFIFEPFRQADSSSTRRYGGLGLGLAIVKQLVAAHGGTARATSEGTGKGSRFVVTFPARAVVPAVAPAPRPPSPSSAALEEAAPALDGLSVLVVDDEEDARAIVAEILRARGAEVRLAASASEALAAFEAARPDVIVSDIGMPETDGYALIRRIRGLPADRGGRTPAVALTAYARGEDARRAFSAGYQMHLVKPVEPARLATVVANLGGKSLDEAGG